MFFGVRHSVSSLAALIVPWQQTIMDFAEENSIPVVDYELLLQQPEINEIIASENQHEPHEQDKLLCLKLETASKNQGHL